MLKWFLGRQLRKFERAYDYDMAYAHAMLEANPKSLFVLQRVGGMASYHGTLRPRAAHLAKLVGSIHEDCGPCVQLGVKLCQQAGIPDPMIEAVVRSEATNDPDVDLVIAYCRTVLADGPEQAALRDQLVARFGQDGLTAVAFVVTAGRTYPMLKKLLGHGVCALHVDVGGESVPLRRAAA